MLLQVLPSSCAIFSTPCVVHREDCDAWWFSGGHSSLEVTQARSPRLHSLRQLAFHFLPRNFSMSNVVLNSHAPSFPSHTDCSLLKYPTARHIAYGCPKTFLPKTNRQFWPMFLMTYQFMVHTPSSLQQ